MINAVVVNFMLLFWVFMIVVPEDCDAEKAKNTPSSPITILLSRATSLMNEGKAQAAYDMLVPFEHKLAGYSDYDYLFGVAALESGHPVKASLALERVLAVKPDFAGARIDLGRAYFAIGNYFKARQEFNIVLKQPNPPPLAKTAVDNYMALIEKKLNEKKNTLFGWAEISGGYDSNVNYSTAEEIVKVPAMDWAAIILSEENIEQDDTFLEFNLSLGLLHEYSRAMRAYVGMEGRKRMLDTVKAFETEEGRVNTYVEFGENINTFRIGGNATLATLDGSLNSRKAGGSLEWRHAVNSFNALTLFGQFDAFRYPGVEINDYDQWVGGISWLHFMPWLRDSMLAASAYGGVAIETEGRADGDNTIMGLRLGYQVKPSPTVSIVAGVGEQLSGYKEENSVFQEEREDQMTDARLSLNWAPVKHVSMGCEFSYIQNNSNIPIYEYKRNEVAAKVRYYFF